MKNKYIELQQHNEIDDIIVENQNNHKTRQRNVEKSLDELNIEEMSKMIHSFEPPKIKDWPKRPYKSIMIIFLLLFSGILFLSYSIVKFFSNSTYDIYLPYFILGFMLIIPGLYYTCILVLILIGKEGYKYKEIPNLSE